jgi:radical SAM protein (TIGR01212 family)
MRQLNTFGRYLKKKYHKPVKKIPLSISGFTCPNIDGRVGKGGCTYCENESFSPNMLTTKSKFFLNPDSLENPLLKQQLKEIDFQYLATSNRFKTEMGITDYIAYFQSFSNTYAPLDTLKALYSHALSKPGMVGISIGTRADCVEEGLFEYLAELSKDVEVWIEFGIQSTYNSVLDGINRAESFEQIAMRIKEAKSYGLNVCGHMIFGLPGESVEMMKEGMKRVYELDIDSIKFHPCYVTKNTALAAQFNSGKFKPLNEKEYVALLADVLKEMPENISIQRFSAGISDTSLLAPSWCGLSKNSQTAMVKEALAEVNLYY